MSENLVCACHSTDARTCIKSRYAKPFICDDASDEPELVEECECACHDEFQDDWGNE